MLAACKRAEKEKEAETRELYEEENSEQEENETFTYTALSSEGFFSGESLEEKSSSDEKKGNWEDDPDSNTAFEFFGECDLRASKNMSILKRSSSGCVYSMVSSRPSQNKKKKADVDKAGGKN